MHVHGATFDPSLVDERADAGHGVAFRGGGPLARVHTLSCEFEAHVLVEALEAERIEVVVDCHLDKALGALFAPQQGWGCLLTRFTDAPAAVELIQRTLADLAVANKLLGEPVAGTPREDD